MRFLKISGPGVVHDEAFCPNCHVLLDAQESIRSVICATMTTRQGARQRRILRCHR